MRVSRRAAALAAAVIVGLTSVIAAGAASASSTSSGTQSGQILRLHTLFVSSTVNDAGQGGPGNVEANLFDLQTPNGVEAGKAYISCTIVTADVELCHAGFVLAGGQIEAQGAIPMSATTFTAAVIGGTGVYEGVTGQIRNVVSAPGVIDRTFHLIRPQRG